VTLFYIVRDSDRRFGSHVIVVPSNGRRTRVGDLMLSDEEHVELHEMFDAHNKAKGG